MYPILLQLTPSFFVKSSYFFMFLGLILATVFFVREATKNRLRVQFIVDILWRLVLGGIVGGRLFYVALNYQFYFFEFSISSIIKSLAFWADKSLSFWGVVFGVVLSFIHYANKRQENPQKWADSAMLSFLLFMVFVNFGAFLDGSNFGRPTESFVGVQFLNNINVKYLTPIHPTQLYAAFYCILIFMMLRIVQKNYRHQYEGLVFMLGVFMYSICRFVESFYRGDDSVLQIFGLFRIEMILFGLASVYFIKKLYVYQMKYHTKLLLPIERFILKIINK